jgi:hypothetical protein
LNASQLWLNLAVGFSLVLILVVAYRYRIFLEYCIKWRESQLHRIEFPFRNKCNFFECIFLLRFSISSISTCVNICIWLFLRYIRWSFWKFESSGSPDSWQWLLLSFAFASHLFRFLAESVSFRFSPGFCLLGRLSLMRTVQLMKKMLDASKQKPGLKRKLTDSARKRNKCEANAKLNILSENI